MVTQALKSLDTLRKTEKKTAVTSPPPTARHYFTGDVICSSSTYLHSDRPFSGKLNYHWMARHCRCRCHRFYTHKWDYSIPFPVQTYSLMQQNIRMLSDKSHNKTLPKESVYRCLISWAIFHVTLLRAQCSKYSLSQDQQEHTSKLIMLR